MESSSTIGREAWASVLGAGSVLGNLASALRWGPLRELGIDARYGVRPSAWVSVEVLSPRTSPSLGLFTGLLNTLNNIMRME